MGRVAKLSPPWVAEPPQSWMVSSAQPPREVQLPAQKAPPNFQAGCVLVAWKPPSLPPR